MCYQSVQYFTCGHTHKFSTGCELTAHDGPFAINLNCPNYRSETVRSPIQCGGFSFCCSRTQDGQVIATAYSAYLDLSNQLNDVKARLEGANAYPDGCRNALIESRDALTRDRSEMRVIVLFAHINQDRFAPGSGNRIITEGDFFEPETSLFPRELLEPVLPLVRLRGPQDVPLNAQLTLSQTQQAVNYIFSSTQEEIPNDQAVSAQEYKAAPSATLPMMPEDSPSRDFFSTTNTFKGVNTSDPQGDASSATNLFAPGLEDPFENENLFGVLTNGNFPFLENRNLGQ